MSIYKDTLRRDIFNKSNQVFKNFNPYKTQISKNIKEIQQEFGDFYIPKIITINNGIDYILQYCKVRLSAFGFH